MGVYDSSRWVLRALRFRSYSYLQTLEQHFGHQCHGHRFHVWRWERNIYGFFGSEWIEQTLDHELWAATFPEWLAWGKITFNTKAQHRGRGVKRFRVSLEKGLAYCLEDPATSLTDASSSSSTAETAQPFEFDIFGFAHLDE